MLRSLYVLALVSMARVRFRGNSDSRSKTAISCGRLSSATAKSWRVKPPTMAPFGSVTFTKTLTSFTSMRNVMPSCATTNRAPYTDKAAARKKARGVRAGVALRSIVCLQAQCCGESLARGPYCPVYECFFLPDRHGGLERVDEPAAGVEGLRTVGRCDNDQHTRFAHCEAAETVDEGHMAHCESLPRFSGKLAQLAQRHLFIGLVIQMQRLTTARVIAHDAIEDDDRAIFALFGIAD